MFTRTELELLTIQQLRILCNRYGLRPTGNSGYKDSYITTLMAFSVLALKQLEDNKGLRLPSFGSLQAMNIALDEMNTPTDEQIALIRISLEGRRMNYPDRYDQEKLLAIYKAKLALEQVINLLEVH
ncbi:hypothetical protein [Halotia branconii]|uniref:Uncharacterized protein n=1 Tax=Halotia branconii CENA392 TaxID=1539056 RepID=A0AAJ6P7I7_9CYAN|nr:hypothetical protein [Halotia branconii]WGV23666.1 hypothetical protein QI031_17830 [Halotia branconii CENA392]